MDPRIRKGLMDCLGYVIAALIGAFCLWLLNLFVEAIGLGGSGL